MWPGWSIARPKAIRALTVGGAALDAMVGGLLLLVVGITLAATAIRYVFGGALPWAHDATLLFFVWMIQLGALRTVHIRIDFVVELMPPRIAGAVRLLTSALSVVALMVITWGAVKMAEFVANDFYVSMPWLSEQYRYYPLFLVGPVWAAMIVANQLGWKPGQASD